jgi:hypothetical protein
MERRRRERRQDTRGYSPERRTAIAPDFVSDLRREQRRLKDRRQTERRGDGSSPFFLLDEIVSKDE